MEPKAGYKSENGEDCRYSKSTIPHQELLQCACVRDVVQYVSRLISSKSSTTVQLQVFELDGVGEILSTKILNRNKISNTNGMINQRIARGCQIDRV